MITQMDLHIEEVERISTLMKKHGAQTCTVERNSNSGIGYTLYAKIPVILSGEHGEFTIEITGTEKW